MPSSGLPLGGILHVLCIGSHVFPFLSMRGLLSVCLSSGRCYIPIDQVLVLAASLVHQFALSDNQSVWMCRKTPAQGIGIVFANLGASSGVLSAHTVGGHVPLIYGSPSCRSDDVGVRSSPSLIHFLKFSYAALIKSQDVVD